MRLAEDGSWCTHDRRGGEDPDWMEEWLQTEWPQLQVAASVTTLGDVPGGRPRPDVIGAVFGDVDVTNEAFPFMTWRETSLDGVPCGWRG